MHAAQQCACFSCNVLHCVHALTIGHPVTQTPARPVQQAYLSRGGNDWQPMAAACTLHLLPSLKRVEFRFSFSEMSPPQDLLARLLSPAAPLAPLGVQQLQHLAMVFPVRSMAQPTVQLPDAMSLLTQVQTTPAVLFVPNSGSTRAL